MVFLEQALPKEDERGINMRPAHHRANEQLAALPCQHLEWTVRKFETSCGALGCAMHRALRYPLKADICEVVVLFTL